MVLFDPKNTIKKYDDECEILDEFYNVRFQMYHERKESMIKRLKQEFDRAFYQFKFVSDIISGELNLYKKKKDQVIQMLGEKGYKTYQQIYGLKEI